MEDNVRIWYLFAEFCIIGKENKRSVIESHDSKFRSIIHDQKFGKAVFLEWACNKEESNQTFFQRPRNLQIVAK